MRRERSRRSPASPPPGRARSGWRRRLRALLLSLVGLLYVFSIPWYRASGEAPALIWGLPDWVSVALACYGVAALLNAAAWLSAEIPERDEAGDGEAPR